MLVNRRHHSISVHSARRSAVLAALVAPLALTGCLTAGQLHVASIQSRDASFVTQRSFRFLPMRAHCAVQPDAPTLDDPMLESSISGREVRHQIAKELMARGYARGSDSADLVIAYYVGAYRTLVVTDYDYGYPFWDPKSGPTPEQSWPYHPSSYEYEQGTVIIDILDRNARHLLWRGVGRTDVPNDPAKYASKLSSVVTAVIARFPGHPPEPSVAAR